MPMHPPFTITGVRVFDGTQTLTATCLRVVDGRIAALGAASISRPGDAVFEGAGGTLLPGLVDAHVHLLPGVTQLAATFGVTTLVDQFSKPEVIGPERAAVAAAEAGRGPARADLRTSSIGATAPGGHPTIAYSPIPYVTGPVDALPFVEARITEGATHLKVIYDDGSGAWLNIPALDVATIEALVAAAHRHDLPVVAHVSTARGAVTVARCGVDVLAHAPFDRMTEAEVRDVARTGVALIATLSIIDGFPDRDRVMPLLAQPELAARLSPRWRRVLDAQSRRWTPPEAPDGAAARENTLALFESGVRVLAGTDAPNPGLVPGASLHRELQHLVRAGLRPTEALTAATTAPAQVFDLTDRGRLVPGARADLVLIDGNPTADVTATQRLRRVWVLGQEVLSEAYAGSSTERAGITWLRESTAKIVAAIQELWPDIPAPQPVYRDEDGELLGRVIPTAGGWQAVTTFGAPLGEVTSRDQALETVRVLGLACLAKPWWARLVDQDQWREIRLIEVHPDRVRLRWTDPALDQSPSGQWFELEDLDLTLDRPIEFERR
jgi:imidazolonepropionase-like amidohydrolase